MLNRSAIVVRPRQPLVDWVNSIEDPAPPDVTLDQTDATLYLVPESEDPGAAEGVLERVWREIFCRELEAWHTDEATWPRRLTLATFKEWFAVEWIGMVEDVGRGPVENDEDPRERHRFSPPPPPRRPPPRKKKPRR